MLIPQATVPCPPCTRKLTVSVGRSGSTARFASPARSSIRSRPAGPTPVSSCRRCAHSVRASSVNNSVVGWPISRREVAPRRARRCGHGATAPRPHGWPGSGVHSPAPRRSRRHRASLRSYWCAVTSLVRASALVILGSRVGMTRATAAWLRLPNQTVGRICGYQNLPGDTTRPLHPARSRADRYYRSAVAFVSPSAGSRVCRFVSKVRRRPRRT